MAFTIRFNSRFYNQKGFASFEFAWGSLIFVVVIMVFFQFFHFFHRTHRNLLNARKGAFSAVWRPTSPTTMGLISKNEVGCAGSCRYTGSFNGDPKDFTMVDMPPDQHVFLVLEDI